MTRILALDLSLTRAGVCRLLETRAGQPVFTVETVHVPKVRIPGAKPNTTKSAERVGTARLVWWRQWLADEQRGCDYGLIAMEAPALMAPGRKMDKAELYGVVKVACAELAVPLLVVSIQAIKLYATGHGNADKQRMLDTAQTQFGEQIRTEDEADAAWLCRLAAQWEGDVEDSDLHRQAAVAAVDKKGLDK